MSGVKDRTSARKKKPVERFGNLVPHPHKTRKDNRILQIQNDMATKPAAPSNHTGSSRKSQAAAARLQLVLQKKADELIATMEEEHLEKKKGHQMQIAQLESELEVISSRLTSLQTEIDDEGCSVERKAELQMQILNTMTEVSVKKNQINSKQIELQSDIDHVDLRKKRVQQVADSDKEIAAIDAELEDLNEQAVSLPEVDNHVDKADLTSKWAENSRQEEYSTDDEEEVRALTERLLKLSAPEKEGVPDPGTGDGTKNGTTIPKPHVEQNCVPTPVDLSAFGQASQMIAQAIQQALSSSQPQQTSTDRFLARQLGRDLPTFDGRPEQWPGFIAAYESSNNSCQYKNAENLARLQKCLKGEAYKAVQSLLITPDSVPTVIQQLRKRFGSPEHIIMSMMMKVREIPVVRPDKLETLIDFGTSVQNLRATITALSCPQHLNNPILLQELVEKLPVQQQLQWMSWAQLDPTRKQSIAAFADWIETQTDLACLLCPPTFKSETPRPQKGRPVPRERVHAVTEGEKNPKRKPFRSERREKKCPYCDKSDHRIQSCPDFIKLEGPQRWKFVRDNRNCFSCLNLGHSTKECSTKRECGLDGCTRDHHKLLHFPKKEENTFICQPEENGVPETQPESVSTINGSVHTVIPTGFISLKVIPVVLRGTNGKKMKVLAFLDDGSTLTLIDEEVAHELGLSGMNGPDEKLNITCFQANVALNTKTVDLVVESVDGRIIRSLSNVKTTPNISLPQQGLRKDLIKKYDHLRGINFSTYDMGKPKILIGMDHAEIVLSRELKFGRGNAPIASRTLFGWALCGPVPFNSRERYGYHIREMMDDDLHQLVKHQFTTESFGVKPCNQAPRSKADARAQLILDSTLTRVSDGWETGLLWKEEAVQLPQSKRMALKRLYTMEKKMDSDPEFAKQYQMKIADYQMKGFARRLSPAEARVETHKTYYLPHFMAFNPKKPNKLRFVFDAASKSNGSSLNDHLLQGPDKLVSLPGVLLKFRQRRVGFTADIQDMFHRVKVKKDDAQSQRFLWRGMDRNREPDVMEMGVLIFGAACSPSCAQEAKNRNAEEFREEFPNAYQAITNRHYVDDYLDSCDTPEEAVQLYHDVRTIQSKGGFNLCNWLSSSAEMMTAIPTNLHAYKEKQLDEEKELLMERVLGLFWKPSPDIFTFSLSYLKTTAALLNGGRLPTKRELLSLTMSIYDPLGLVTILTIKARALLQATWRSKVGWNEEIPPEIHSRWRKWIEEVTRLPTFEVNRCYSPHFSSADEVQLHVFGDAGEEAFGCVAYLVVKKGAEIHTSLVMSKARVAPMKTLSMPRLELQAALMCSRLAHFIIEQIEIPINKIFLWSDSSTVIKWIRADGKRFHQFVAHRVGEIQELSEVSQWRWIPTALNVADELTRMDRPCDWSPSSRWINGPDFLRLPEEDWPKEKEQISNSQMVGEEFELRKNQLFLVSPASPLIEPAKFSSWRRLIRVTAYVLRFTNLVKNGNFSSHRQKRKCLNPTSSQLSHKEALTVMELEKAETWWWKTSQLSSFPSEYSSLKSNKPINKTSRLLKLSPYLDEFGVMRVRGRIDNAEGIAVSVKRPVILDKRSPYTKLLVRHYHEVCDHHGHERVVNEIRQKFHIINIRSAVKKAKMMCQACKNMKAKPSIPEMGVLPKYRLDSHVFPFTATGVDYFGPIEVVVKRSKEKRYGCLFTCLSTRAVHLEVANSLSTDSCILAIRRFVGRRGCPSHIYSDNGTNFHGANNELLQSLAELNQTRLEEECSVQGIQWNFNPPSASHFGGSWERMVRAVKVAMGATLEMKNLSDEVLNTVMVEAEHVVNSHPLTYVPDDPDDPEALTPNHFLIGRSSNLQPTGRFDEKEIFGRKQWRISQQLADHFWRRWIREYLPTLLRREKWCLVSRPIQVGDVVVEVNPSLSRNSWPKGRVVQVYPGQDKLIRVADIKMSNGHVYRRPVAKLCILDVLPKENENSLNLSNPPVPSSAP